MYRVSIELLKHEWMFGRTRNAVGTRGAASVSIAFLSSAKLSRCVYNSLWVTTKFSFVVIG